MKSNQKLDQAINDFRVAMEKEMERVTEAFHAVPEEVGNVDIITDELSNPPGTPEEIRGVNIEELDLLRKLEKQNGWSHADILDIAAIIPRVLMTIKIQADKINRQRTVVQNYDHDRDEYDDRIKSLETIIADLKKQLQESDDRADYLKDQNIKHAKELMTRQGSVNLVKEELTRAKTVMADRYARITELSSRLEAQRLKAEDDQVSLKAEINEDSRILEERSVTIRGLSKECSRLQEEVEHWKRKCSAGT